MACILDGKCFEGDDVRIPEGGGQVTSSVSGEDPRPVSWVYAYSLCMALALGGVLVAVVIGQVFAIPGAADWVWTPIAAVLVLAGARAMKWPAWTVLLGAAVSVGSTWLDAGWAFASASNQMAAINNIADLYSVAFVLGLTIAPMVLCLIDARERPHGHAAQALMLLMVFVGASAPTAGDSIWDVVWQQTLALQVPLFAAIVATSVLLSRRFGSFKAALAVLAALVVCALAYGIGPGGMFGYATGFALTAAWVGVVLARRARLGLWRVIFALVAPIGVIVLAQIGSAFLYEWVVR